MLNGGTNTDVGISSAGTCAVLNTLRSQNITGWTLWTPGLGGSTTAQWKDIVEIGGNVIFLTNRDGELWLERLSDTHTLDHATKATISSGLTGTVTFTNGGSTVTGVGSSFTVDLSTGDQIYLSTDGIDFRVAVGTIQSDVALTLQTNYAGRSTSGTADVAGSVITLSTTTPWSTGDELGVKADGEYLGTITVSTSTSGVSTADILTLSRGASTVEYGALYSWQAVTLPNDFETRGGVTSNELRRVSAVHVSMQNSKELTVQQFGSTRTYDVQFAQSTAGPGLAAFTGRKRVQMLGWGRDFQVELSGDDPQPVHIRSIVSEVA